MGRRTGKGDRRGGAAATARPANGARWFPLGLLGVAAVAGLVHVGALGGGFVWDDGTLIVRNSALDSAAGVWRAVGEDLFAAGRDSASYGYWRPLVTLSFALDRALGGREPFGFHLTNLLLDVACSVLVALLVRALLGAGAPALAAGLLFAVHPMHVENVAFISGRTDLLAFLAVAVTLLLHFGLAAPGPGAEVRRAGLARVVGAVAVYLLALLAKEMAVVAVAWIALVELVQRRSGWRRAAVAVAPYLAATVAYLALRLVVVRVALPGRAGPTVTQVLLTAPVTLVRYLLWLLLPLRSRAFVENPPVSSPVDPWFLAALIALAFLAWGAVALWRRLRPGAAAAAMVLVGLAPLLGFLPVKGPADMGLVMAERLLYFASFPFVALVVLLLPELLRRLEPRTRRVVLTSGWVVVCGGWAALTVGRVPDWRDDVTLFTATLAQAPGSPTVVANLANAWAERGDFVRAGEVIERAPGPVREARQVQIAWAQVLVATGRTTAAIPVLEGALREGGPDDARARNNLACLYRLAGRSEEALALLEGLVRDGQDVPETHVNLAEIYRARGDPERARAAYRRALAGRPDDTAVVAAFADLEAAAGRADQAAVLLSEGLAHHPQDPALLSRLAALNRGR